MRATWVLRVGGFILASAGTASAADAIKVTITNPLGAPRWSETVALNFAELKKIAPALDPQKTVVLDSASKLVDSQLVDMDGDDAPDQLVFQTELGSSQSKAFTVQLGERKPFTRDQFKVYGRFIRERHDDFAWENDRIARRMYGRDLETWAKEPLASSGIDIWVKRVTKRVINDWYMVDDYHRDNGDGGDFYSVGKTRGCGGLGIWSGGKLYNSRNFVNSRVLANGPIRLVFELNYEAWDVAGSKVSETKRVILDAGKNFDRFESTFRVESGKGPLAVGIGIAKHPGGTAQADKRLGVLRSFEPFKDNNGHVGCAVVVGAGKATDAPQTDTDSLLVTSVPATGPVVYYAGFAWDKSTDVADDKIWAKRVEGFAKEAFAPAKVKLSAATPLPAPTVGFSGPDWSVRVCDTLMEKSPAVLSDKWNYDTGLGLRGFLAVWQKTHETKYFDYVKRTIDGLIDADGAIKGYQLDDYNLDQVNPGKVLFTLLEYATDGKERERYKKALGQLRAQLASQPRTKEGGFWHKKVYPSQMWLDGVYMSSPFLAEYAETFHEPALFDEVAKQILLIEKHTRDPNTGLLFHGWDESKAQKWANPESGTSANFWGRALGWYAMALVDVLEHFPKNHPKRAELVPVLERLAKAVSAVQDPATGVWWQVLDQGARAKNYREQSASAMFTYALTKAVQNGWIDSAKYEPVARRAYQGLTQSFVSVDAKGQVTVNGTCKVAGLGGNPYRDGSYEYYTTGTEVIANDAKGVAAFVLASAERN
ncbi:MAG TPA: glycoside hydrolase family 88 protein [Polyangiaceae bacterium]|nr:glycoside hydrolase family 88 protein [Polyangiaceae bacterium]